MSKKYFFSAEHVHRHLPELLKQSTQRTIDLDPLVSGSEPHLVAKSIILKGIEDINDKLPMADVLVQILTNQVAQYGYSFRDHPARFVEVFCCICNTLSFPGRGLAYGEGFGYSEELVDGLWYFVVSSTDRLMACQGLEGFYKMLWALFHLCPSPDAGDKIKRIVRSISASDNGSANEIHGHAEHDGSDIFFYYVQSALL